jgi:hypothetical protein
MRQKNKCVTSKHDKFELINTQAVNSGRRSKSKLSMTINHSRCTALALVRLNFDIS